MEQKKRRPTRRRRRRSSEQVVYTQPKVFNRKKFFLQLATVLAIVLALVFTLSIFFRVGSVENKAGEKVSAIYVAGNQRYTAQQVVEASGIQQGESLLGLNKAQIRARILERLPYVNSVQVGIKLPDSVNIKITESSVLYSVEALDSNWWLMDCTGKIVEQTNWLDAKDHTVVTGIRIQIPELGKKAVAMDPEPEVDEEGNTIPVTVTGEQRMAILLEIMDLLERFGILGMAASIDMTELGDIQIWYGEQYRIDLGDYKNLEKKLGAAVSAIDQLDDHRTGVIDVSFTVKPDQAAFTSFEEK